MNKFKKLAIGLSALLCVVVPALAQSSRGETIVVNKFQRLQSAGQINSAFGSLLNELQTRLPNLRISPKDMVTIVAKDIEQLAAGNVQMMVTQGSYYSNTELAFLLLSSPPFMPAEKFLKWRQSSEGEGLANAIYAKYGVKSMPCFVIDANMDFVARRPLGDMYTLNGAKIAIPGTVGSLYSATGASAFALPFSELRTTLEKGLIDGAYTWTPHESIELQLYESVQALYAPSVVRSFFVAELLISLRFWNGLSPAEQESIASACSRLRTETQATSQKLAAQAMAKYQAGGILVAQLPDGAVEAIRKKWEDTAQKRAVFDANFQAIYKSLYER